MYRTAALSVPVHYSDTHTYRGTYCYIVAQAPDMQVVGKHMESAVPEAVQSQEHSDRAVD